MDPPVPSLHGGVDLEMGYGGILSRRSGKIIITLRVDSCPDEEFVGTNRTYANPATLQALNFSARRTLQEQPLHVILGDNEGLAYVLIPSHRMKEGSIGLNSMQRSNLEVPLGASLPVSVCEACALHLASVCFEIHSSTPR